MQGTARGFKRPPPAAETGSNFWRSGLQDASAAQGTKRMQGTARGFKRPQPIPENEKNLT
jgi:hypothetical protein